MFLRKLQNNRISVSSRWRDGSLSHKNYFNLFSVFKVPVRINLTNSANANLSLIPTIPERGLEFLRFKAFWINWKQRRFIYV